MINRDYFTLVFQGDIGKFKNNPLKTETPYGVPISVARGHSFEEADMLIDAVERIERACQGPASYSADHVRREVLQIAQGALLALSSGDRGGK